MFKTDIEYTYDVPLLDSTNKEFKISPSDLLNVAVFTNEGAIVFETTSSRERMMVTMESTVSFLVESDGFVELPILGRIGLFYRQVISELSKVVWPTRNQLTTYTAVVLVFVGFVVLVVSSFDLVLTKITFWIFG